MQRLQRMGTAMQTKMMAACWLLLWLPKPLCRCTATWLNTGISAHAAEGSTACATHGQQCCHTCIQLAVACTFGPSGSMCRMH